MKVSLKFNPLKCSAKTSDVINVINVGTHESNAWVHVCKNVSIVHSLWCEVQQLLTDRPPSLSWSDQPCF